MNPNYACTVQLYAKNSTLAIKNWMLLKHNPSKPWKDSTYNILHKVTSCQSLPYNQTACDIFLDLVLIHNVVGGKMKLKMIFRKKIFQGFCFCYCLLSIYSTNKIDKKFTTELSLNLTVRIWTKLEPRSGFLNLKNILKPHDYRWIIYIYIYIYIYILWYG